MRAKRIQRERITAKHPLRSDPRVDLDLPRDLSEIDYARNFDMCSYIKMIQRGFSLEPRLEEII